MKSISHIFENIVDTENIINTMFRATKGKKNKYGVIRDLLRYDKIVDNAEFIKEGLEKSLFPLQGKRTPKLIHEQSANKDRIIYPPNMTEHVIHHLVCQELEPIFKRSMYDFCVASVPGRGSSYGKKFMQKWVKSYNGKKVYVLKLDIHHFFDSIDRQLLFNKLSKKIKDERFLEVVRKIIWYDGDKNTTGIPIGFYTSQWFANFFLQDFDYFVKQQLHIQHYMRYMDDMILLHTNKRELRHAYDRIVEYLHNMGLSLNNKHQLFRFSYISKDAKERGRAIDFMGFVFHVNRTTIRKRTLFRARRKANRVAKKSKYSWYEAVQLISMVGRLKRTDTHQYFEKYILCKINLKQAKDVVSRHTRKESKRRMYLNGLQTINQ